MANASGRTWYALPVLGGGVLAAGDALQALRAQLCEPVAQLRGREAGVAAAHDEQVAQQRAIHQRPVQEREGAPAEVDAQQVQRRQRGDDLGGRRHRVAAFRVDRHQRRLAVDGAHERAEAGQRQPARAQETLARLGRRDAARRAQAVARHARRLDRVHQGRREARAGARGQQTPQRGTPAGVRHAVGAGGSGKMPHPASVGPDVPSWYPE
jgi:hypothetical protein